MFLLVIVRCCILRHSNNHKGKVYAVRYVSVDIWCCALYVTYDPMLRRKGKFYKSWITRSCSVHTEYVRTGTDSYILHLIMKYDIYIYIQVNGVMHGCVTRITCTLNFTPLFVRFNVYCACTPQLMLVPYYVKMYVMEREWHMCSTRAHRKGIYIYISRILKW